MPKIKANGLELEYEVHGDPSAEPMLLIMGLGSQMTRWPPALYNMLVERGLRVIRYDNRDVGLSEKLEGQRVDFPAIAKAVAEGRKPDVPYTLEDMANDAVGLMDTLGIKRAHIVGASLGGMIAQTVTINHPERVLSLTSIMSTTGNRALDMTTPEAGARLTNRGPDPNVDLEGFLDHAMETSRIIGSPAYPIDPAKLRERLHADFKRSYYPAGFARQYAAALAAPDRREKLKQIKVPVMVLHGEADPLLKVAGGRDTHANIPGSELRVLPGMGHDLPPALYNDVVDAIMSAVNRARAPVG